VLGNTLTTESATGTPVAAVLPEGAS
jgi:hypothetical protein